MAQNPNGRAGHSPPELTLNMAVPDPIKVNLKKADGTIEIGWLRPVEDYSTRERKRLSALMQATLQFEQSPEDVIKPEDEQSYELALRQLVMIAMPDLSQDIRDGIGIPQMSKMAAFLAVLFFNTNRELTNAPASAPQQEVQPTKLRTMAGKLTSLPSLRGSVASTEDGRATG